MPRGFYGHGLPGIDAEHLQGRLIVIEGADGSGRSTQIQMLRDALEQAGHPTVDVGLKRSRLVGQALDNAMQGNILSPISLKTLLFPR
jgi:dTMP kinase